MSRVLNQKLDCLIGGNHSSITPHKLQCTQGNLTSKNVFALFATEEYL